MAKVNLTVNLDDENVLDDVAQQVIRGQVRKIVQEEIEKNIRLEIIESVERYIGRVAKAIKDTGWYTSDKNLRDTMREKILEKAAEMSVSNDGLKSAVDDLFEPLRKYINQKQMYFEKDEKEMDGEIADQIRRRVDALFKTTLTTALAEALIKNGGQ